MTCLPRLSARGAFLRLRSIDCPLGEGCARACCAPLALSLSLVRARGRARCFSFFSRRVASLRFVSFRLFRVFFLPRYCSLCMEQDHVLPFVHRFIRAFTLGSGYSSTTYLVETRHFGLCPTVRGRAFLVCCCLCQPRAPDFRRG